MVQQLYQELQRHATLHIFPPRYTLREPTYSGVAHQFDVVIREDENTTVVECKFREKTGIDELFAFAGKLVDYRNPLQGVFVTTSGTVNDDAFQYAIAHHIQIICSTLAPVAYMGQCVKRDTDLARRLNNLQARLKDDCTPSHILVEWKNAHRRFVSEGYDQ